MLTSNSNGAMGSALSGAIYEIDVSLSSNNTLPATVDISSYDLGNIDYKQLTVDNFIMKSVSARTTYWCDSGDSHSGEGTTLSPTIESYDPETGLLSVKNLFTMASWTGQSRGVRVWITVKILVTTSPIITSYKI